MLTTTVLGLKKPETADASSGLRTSISDNADIVEARVGANGTCVVTAAETRTNTAFGLMTTPDQVSGIVVPTNGLVLLSFTAMWKAGAVSQAPEAAIFIGANQLRVSDIGNDTFNPQKATLPSNAASIYYRVLTSYSGGLLTHAAGGTHSIDQSNPPSTGFVVQTDLAAGDGGLCVIDGLAAGTYTFSVQWRNPTGGGSVTAQQRRLRVWVRT